MKFTGQRCVNKYRVTRLPALEVRTCPVHGTKWRTLYTPSPCRKCEPELFDKLYPLRGKYSDADRDSK